ncbi:LysR substrate-binding domain-containing protein [Variovorax sp. HJSM1_2]|uniref:LysR substrate-binding domain-containing protein n=1 Tax=Variovorax sp. HJSM1_2 TaxID=3366263 RepID=UPI003BD9AA0B
MEFDPAHMGLLLRLRTRQLLLLKVLDQHRNLGRAATAMNISQPAATKLLQQLEEAVKAELFTRTARGMTPTLVGEALIRYAHQVLTDFGTLHEEISALKGGLTGLLRIGSVPGAVPELLAPTLIDYKQRHPRVAVSVLVDTSDVMLAQLGRGQVDLMLGRLTPGHDADSYASTQLLGESQVVVARTGHPLFARQVLAFDDVLGWPWILQPPGSPQRGHFEAALTRAGLRPRLDITESSSTIVATALLELSDMLAVMPASLAAHYARLGVLRVLPLALPVHVPPVHLVTRRDRQLSPAALAYVHLLQGQREESAAVA